jgi:hypothetical protein
MSKQRQKATDEDFYQRLVVEMEVKGITTWDTFNKHIVPTLPQLIPGKRNASKWGMPSTKVSAYEVKLRMPKTLLHRRLDACMSSIYSPI